MSKHKNFRAPVDEYSYTSEYESIDVELGLGAGGPAPQDPQSEYGYGYNPIADDSGLKSCVITYYDCTSNPRSETIQIPLGADCYDYQPAMPNCAPGGGKGWGVFDDDPEPADPKANKMCPDGQYWSGLYQTGCLDNPMETREGVITGEYIAPVYTSPIYTSPVDTYVYNQMPNFNDAAADEAERQRLATIAAQQAGDKAAAEAERQRQASIQADAVAAEAVRQAAAAEAERQKAAAITASISAAQVFGAQREAAVEAERKAAVEAEGKIQAAVEAEKQAVLKRKEAIIAQTIQEGMEAEKLLGSKFINTPNILETAVIKTPDAPAPAAESNRTLLIGGVILAAVVVYFLTKKND